MLKIERNTNGVLDVEDFLAKAKSSMPLAFRCLAAGGEGLEQFWQSGSGNHHFRNLCHYIALGGFFPSKVMEAFNTGNVVNYGPRYDWLPSNVPEFDGTDKLNSNSIVITKPRKNGTFSDDARKVIDSVEAIGAKVYTHKQLYLENLLETEVTQETVETYIHNIGGRLVDGWWVIYSYRGLKFKCEEGTWTVIDGKQTLSLRNYHSLNGVPLLNKHKVMLLTINYLFSSRDTKTLEGRKAFLSGVFVEKVTAGYTHKILDQGLANKLGALGFYIEGKLGVYLYDTGDLLIPIAEFEKLGYSVFFHKGAGYAIINAQMVGFSRKDNTSHVPYHADKRAKLTGRVLSMVPTAGLWVED